MSNIKAYKTFFTDEMKKLSVDVSDETYEKLCDYYDLLIEKNKVMNLTAITEPKEVLIKHFMDSAMMVKVVDPSDKDIIDIGTGAGFPGMVIKILFPKSRVVLIDSLKKRIGFLNELIDKLQITDIEAIHGRAEEFGHDENFREKFDFSVSRAVAGLNVLCELCLPFVKVGGKFISYKSGNIASEILEAENSINLLGGKFEPDVIDFDLIGEEKVQSRSLVVISRCICTPEKYPRRPGIPAKRPL